MGLKPSSSPLVFTHQQFVDDMILGAEASVREARSVKGILNTYSKASRDLKKYEGVPLTVTVKVGEEIS